MARGLKIVVFGLCLASVPLSAMAQQGPNPKGTQVFKVRKEIFKLQQQLADLRSKQRQVLDIVKALDRQISSLQNKIRADYNTLDALGGGA